MKAPTVSFQDLIYAYANLRSIAHPTGREEEMILALEPHIYRQCTTLVERQAPWMEKFGEILKAFHAGEHEAVIRLMGEMEYSEAAPPKPIEKMG